MRVLVSGGLGFIGSNFIRQSISKYDGLTNIDNLSHGSNPWSLEDINGNPRYLFVKGDIADQALVSGLTKDVNLIVNFAAQSHVDRSIFDPTPFVASNIMGTYALLEGARKHDVESFLQVSTDEVYGDSETRSNTTFKETDSTMPSNPYSATKAAAESLVMAYSRTYGLRGVITRCSNNFGPYQSPEKLIPKTIIRALRNQSVPLYGGGHQVRSWIYVGDHIEAIWAAIERGKAGEVYNISTCNELSNREIVLKVLKHMKKSEDLIEAVEDRPGHDARYSIDSAKIRTELGWSARHAFDGAMAETVEWYLHNENWWGPMATPENLHPNPWKL